MNFKKIWTTQASQRIQTIVRQRWKTANPYSGQLKMAEEEKTIEKEVVKYKLNLGQQLNLRQ